MPKVAIVILNWNGIDFLKKFLPSVVLYADSAKIYVIDNGSSDDSLAFLANTYPQIATIQLDKNHGFAEGYNRGLERIAADYYILLNSDVEVTFNWWQPLISLLESDDSIAAAQPKILSHTNKDSFEYAGACGGFLDKYGYPFCRGRMLDVVEKDNGQYDNSLQVFWASGAAMAIKAELFHQVNGFDSKFFAHMEEIDLCWRLQNRGCKIYCEPQSTIYHLGGGTLPNESPFKLYLNFRNNLFMLYKNLSPREFFPVLFIRMCLDGVAALKYLVEGNFKAVKSIWKAHKAYYQSLPYLKKQRKQLKDVNQIYAKRYNKSILWQYFAHKKKYFSKIKG